jgi:hypothetical protein
MQFIQPFFLTALAVLAIPILIHLFNFRKYKKVYFTNVRFLADLQQESKKQSQIKQLLILIARLATLACLVLAFAQPYLPSRKQAKTLNSQQVVSIYIDNSWSMEAAGSEGKLLETAKTRAREIVEAYPRSSVFQLVTNDFESQHQQFSGRDEFLKMAGEIKITPATRNLADIITRQHHYLTEIRRQGGDAYLISDFQKSTSKIPEKVPDSLTEWFLVPVAAEKINNLFVDTVYFTSPVHQPGQTVKLVARIHNSGTSALEKIPVKLTINHIRKAIGSVSVEPGSTTELILPYTENSEGIQYGMLEITDYPVTYDDKFYFAYSIIPSIPVLCINADHENPFLNAIFGEDPNFSFKNIATRQLDFSSLLSYSLIILNEPAEISTGLARELSVFINHGGTIMVFPASGMNPETLNAFLSSCDAPRFGPLDTTDSRVGSVNLTSDVFLDVFENNLPGKETLPDNVDLPKVFGHYAIIASPSSLAEPLLKLENGDPFLVRSRYKKGALYLFTTPANEQWTNFPGHILFVPTLYKIALLSKPFIPIYYNIGQIAPIDIPADSTPDKQIFKLVRTDNQYEVIPDAISTGARVSLSVPSELKDAGWYNAVSGSQKILGLGFNYSRKESDLSCSTPAELEDQLKKLNHKNIHIFKQNTTSLTAQIEERNQGTPLWKWFIVAALLFIAAEILLIRFMKQ